MQTQYFATGIEFLSYSLQCCFCFDETRRPNVNTGVSLWTRCIVQLPVVAVLRTLSLVLCDHLINMPTAHNVALIQNGE